MEERISLTEWVERYDNGDFDHNDCDTMIDAGWYDWFCKDSSLYNRLKKMVGMVKACAKSQLVDPDKVLVFFKNNAPVSGGTYDSFSLCELEGDQNVVWWVTSKDGHQDEAVVKKAPYFSDNQNLLGHGCNANDVKRFFGINTIESIQPVLRIAWAREFFHNMRWELIRAGLFENIGEADACLEFHEDLNGEGPAIVKTAGEFEMLGVDICIVFGPDKYVSIPEPNQDFYMEVMNTELMRPFKTE